MDAVFTWISTYGYGALFLLLLLGIVGLPIPDETLLVFCGYLISQRRLTAAGAMMAALAGSWSGVTVSYWLGRTAGLKVVHKFGKYIRLNDAILNRIHAWFDRRGHWALFGGYYVAGVRHFTAIVAGASGVSFPSFMLFAWSGGIFWVAGFLTLGYYIGEDWRRVADLVHSYLHVVSFILAAIVAVYVAVWWAIRRRGTS